MVIIIDKYLILFVGQEIYLGISDYSNIPRNGIEWEVNLNWWLCISHIWILNFRLEEIVIVNVVDICKFFLLFYHLVAFFNNVFGFCLEILTNFVNNLAIPSREYIRESIQFAL